MARDGELEDVKRLMGALVRQPPKPHEKMKLGKPRGKKTKSPDRKRAASAKPRSA
jgi:hypothetical protein